MFQVWDGNVGVLLNNKTPQCIHVNIAFIVRQDVVRKQRFPLSGRQKLSFQSGGMLLICTHKNTLLNGYTNELTQV